MPTYQLGRGLDMISNRWVIYLFICRRPQLSGPPIGLPSQPTDLGCARWTLYSVSSGSCAVPAEMVFSHQCSVDYVLVHCALAVAGLWVLDDRTFGLPRTRGRSVRLWTRPVHFPRSAAALRGIGITPVVTSYLEFGVAACLWHGRARGVDCLAG